jgi:hypothetical protein
VAEWSCSGLQIRLPRFDSGLSLHIANRDSIDFRSCLASRYFAIAILAPPFARVAKSVDARDLKSLAARHAGSSPAPGTILICTIFDLRPHVSQCPRRARSIRFHACKGRGRRVRWGWRKPLGARDCACFDDPSPVRIANTSRPGRPRLTALQLGLQDLVADTTHRSNDGIGSVSSAIPLRYGFRHREAAQDVVGQGGQPDIGADWDGALLPGCGRWLHLHAAPRMGRRIARRVSRCAMTLSSVFLSFRSGQCCPSCSASRLPGRRARPMG